MKMIGRIKIILMSVVLTVYNAVFVVVLFFHMWGNSLLSPKKWAQAGESKLKPAQSFPTNLLQPDADQASS